MPTGSAKRNLGGFSFELDGEVQLSIALSRMIRAVDDLRPFGPAFREAFNAVELEQFGSQGAKGRDGRWAALSKPYEAWKRKRWGNKPILQASGRLMEALTGKSGDTLLISEPHLIGLGAVVDYGSYHQHGTSRMPARKPISVGSRQESRIFGRALGEMARTLGLMWEGKAGSADFRSRKA